MSHNPLTPAKAGVHFCINDVILAFAGMNG